MPVYLPCVAMDTCYSTSCHILLVRCGSLHFVCVCLPLSADHAFELVKGVVPRSSISVMGSSRRGRNAERNLPLRF
jgi:hypothetical protein